MPRIGPFELEAIIGEGGMGTVFRGTDPRFGRPVAIKVLHDHLARQQDLLDRFRSEASIEARLQHPNIVRVFDFIEDGSRVAIVMELVDGPSLEELIATTERGLGPERLRTIFSQVLDAIGYAHTQGLVHRDIKPSNVRVAELDDQPIAKVMDFGVAKILGSDKVRTASAANIGTLAYMSPEQVTKPAGVDHRADIYSLGVLLYEMASGKLPFEAASEFELMRQIVEAVPRELPGVISDTQGNIQQVATRALMKDPAARYQSCRDMREDFEQEKVTSATPPATSPPPTTVVEPSEDPQQFARKRRKILGRLSCLAAIVVVVSIPLWLTLWGLHSKRVEARWDALDAAKTALRDEDFDLADSQAAEFDRLGGDRSTLTELRSDIDEQRQWRQEERWEEIRAPFEEAFETGLLLVLERWLERMESIGGRKSDVESLRVRIDDRRSDLVADQGRTRWWHEGCEQPARAYFEQQLYSCGRAQHTLTFVKLRHLLVRSLPRDLAREAPLRLRVVDSMALRTAQEWRDMLLLEDRDFGALAREASEDFTSRMKGGEVGWHRLRDDGIFEFDWDCVCPDLDGKEDDPASSTLVESDERYVITRGACGYQVHEVLDRFQIRTPPGWNDYWDRLAAAERTYLRKVERTRSERVRENAARDFRRRNKSIEDAKRREAKAIVDEALRHRGPL